jgi:hypothetical protein
MADSAAATKVPAAERSEAAGCWTVDRNVVELADTRLDADA